jgi:multicomponent Na+:H+ antiporter subunit E
VLRPSPHATDIAFGACATALATWASVRLLPPQTGRIRLIALLAMLPYFLWQSVVAAFDIARRALSPRMQVNPGFVDCPMKLPPGLARNTLATITSLMPGSVPADEVEGALVYHALDATQPVVAQLLETERRFAHTLVRGLPHE